MHPAHNHADRGHQQFPKGDCKLLQLAFQYGKLPRKVILHGLRHARRRAVTICDSAAQFLNIRRGGIHQRKEPAHGILAHQSLRSRRLLRLRQARERHPAVRQDIRKVAHGAVRIGRGHRDLPNPRPADLHLARKAVHHRPQGSTRLGGLDPGIGHQPDGQRRVLNGVAQRPRHRRGGFEGLPHHAHVGVGVGAGRRQHVRKPPRVRRAQPESGQRVRDDIGGGGQIHNALQAAQHIAGLPPRHGHVFQGLPRLLGGEGRGGPHLLGLIRQLLHLAPVRPGDGPHRGHLSLKAPKGVHALHQRVRNLLHRLGHTRRGQGGRQLVDGLGGHLAELL